MPRFLIERTFPDGLALPADEQGAEVCLTVVGNNSTEGVTWIQSYVTPDKKQTFCIYDAPHRKPYAEWRNSINCRWIESTKCVCSIRIFTDKKGHKNEKPNFVHVGVHCDPGAERH